jgi:hypothetical protein
MYLRVPLLFALVWSIILGTSCAAELSKSPFEMAARSRLQVLTTNESNVRFLHSLTNLPPSIREKLAAVADAGQPFSSGCIGSNPHARFLVATKAGGTYNVAIEHGGFIYSWSIVQFVVDEAGKVIREARIAPGGAANGSPPVGH